MARSPATKAEPTSAIVTEAEYDVRLKKPVIVSGFQLLPLHEHVMQGSFLQQIIDEAGPDAIDTATLRQ